MMEAYVLHRTSWDRVAIIENIVSFTWTERYCAYGEFQLVLSYTDTAYHFLRLRRYIEIDDSNRLMIIEGITVDVNESGEELITVIGYSVEKFFQQRVVIPNRDDPEFWARYGNPLPSARELVNQICIQGVLSDRDIIPNLRTGIADSQGTLQWWRLPTNVSLYDNLVSLCESADGGFRLVYDRSDKTMTFDAYAGADRSIEQTDRNQVIFSKDANNIRSSKYVKSQIDHKTAAYVVDSEGWGVLVNSPDGASQGMDYRLMYVDASDIEDPTRTQMVSRGHLALANQKRNTYMEVEVLDDAYPYPGVGGSGYNLGTIVSVQALDGTYHSARVVEHVRTLDSNGYREYPTLKDLTEVD